MIYLDHAATSWPKAEGVAQEIYEYIEQNGCNIGRGSYQKAFEVSAKVYAVRERLCQFFHGEDCSQVIFTSGITQALNMVLKGTLNAGDHVLISPMEHNAVLRPLKTLQKSGVSFTILKAAKDGTIDLEQIDALIQPNTRMLVLNHGSNVNGCLQPIDAISKITQKYPVYFVVDAAQTAGLIDIDCQKYGIDALCFTGHKSLLGPQGTGGVVLSSRMAQQMRPFVEGGTGSFSESDEMPALLPDRFEAGTLNLPGIAGLGKAMAYLLQKDYHHFYEKEMRLTHQFIEEIAKLREVELVLPEKIQLPVVSLRGREMDNAEIAYLLDEKAQIMTRVGLHCAPLAHQHIRTFPQGTLRFSFGHLNSEKDIKETVTLLKEIVRK